MKPRYIRCEACEGCRLSAWIQVSMGGNKAAQFDSTNTCRRHMSSVIAAALAIGNDVRIRSAV